MGHIQLWGKEVQKKVSYLGRIFFIQFLKMPFGRVYFRYFAGYLSLGWTWIQKTALLFNPCGYGAFEL